MKLLFVYNSTLNPVSLVKDFISEIMPQQQANCVLCDITHSLVFKKRAWKTYIASLDIATEFYLKDEFEKKFTVQPLPDFPCAFMLHEQTGEIAQIIKASEINELKNIDELIALVNIKLGAA